MADEMGHIIHVAGQEIIHADDPVTLRDEIIAEVAPKKAGPTGNQGSFHKIPKYGYCPGL